MVGFTHMWRRLVSAQVICYGEPFDAMLDLVDVISVPYARTARVTARNV